jgi:hypothetical protein
MSYATHTVTHVNVKVIFLAKKKKIFYAKKLAEIDKEKLTIVNFDKQGIFAINDFDLKGQH